MASAASRIVGKIGRPLSQGARRTMADAASDNAARAQVLQREARRNPELYILLGVMSTAFGLAGWHFGRKPTSSSSEAPVSMAPNTEPWKHDNPSAGSSPNEHFKYQYHPGGDPKQAPKDAPSALHSVIVPNVTLTKKQHDTFNKYGKEDW